MQNVGHIGFTGTLANLSWRHLRSYRATNSRLSGERHGSVAVTSFEVSKGFSFGFTRAMVGFYCCRGKRTCFGLVMGFGVSWFAEVTESGAFTSENHEKYFQKLR